MHVQYFSSMYAFNFTERERNFTHMIDPPGYGTDATAFSMYVCMYVCMYVTDECMYVCMHVCVTLGICVHVSSVLFFFVCFVCLAIVVYLDLVFDVVVFVCLSLFVCTTHSDKHTQ